MKTAWHSLNWTCVGVSVSMALQCLATEAPELAPLVKGNTAFAMQLYSQVRSNQGNVVVSPYSLSSALAMTYAGARNQTARQMEQALHFPTGEKAIPALFSRLDAALGAARGDGIQLDIANSLWPQKTYPLQRAFLALLKADYRATVMPQDYIHQRDQARAAINKWVDEKTRHKITAAIPPNTFDDLTRLVLINAIYFKGDWNTQFPENMTHPAKFYPAPGRSITVPFMQADGNFDFGENQDLQWLVLPYKGKRFEMVILLPRAGGGLDQKFRELTASGGKKLGGRDTMDGLERGLNPNTFKAWTSSSQHHEVHVVIPRFRISSGVRLNGALRALGIKDAFNPERADFSGMDGRQHWLNLSAVLQNVFIEVNEKGTEAAASSAAVIQTLGPRLLF